MSNASPKPKRSTKIRWDEETIAKHDEERGTRQRIEEPPTPYHYSGQGGQDDDSVYSSSPATDKQGQNLMDQMEQLQARLNFEHLRQREAKDELQADELDGADMGEGDGDDAEGDGRGGVHFDDTSSEKSWHSSRSEEDEEKFRRKQQQHYNEFQVLKAWRQRYSDEDEESLLGNGHANGDNADHANGFPDQPEMIFEAEEEA